MCYAGISTIFESETMRNDLSNNPCWDYSCSGFSWAHNDAHYPNNKKNTSGGVIFLLDFKNSVFHTQSFQNKAFSLYSFKEATPNSTQFSCLKTQQSSLHNPYFTWYISRFQVSLSQDKLQSVFIKISTTYIIAPKYVLIKLLFNFI